MCQRCMKDVSKLIVSCITKTCLDIRVFSLYNVASHPRHRELPRGEAPMKWQGTRPVTARLSRDCWTGTSGSKIPAARGFLGSDSERGHSSFYPSGSVTVLSSCTFRLKSSKCFCHNLSVTNIVGVAKFSVNHLSFTK